MSLHTSTADEGREIKLLETNNFQSWSSVMRAHFLEHNLDGIVDRTETEPTDATAQPLYIVRTKKAAGFITRKLSPQNRDLIITEENHKNPKAIWDVIVNLYASTKARNRARVLRKFLSLTCSDKSLRVFIEQFQSCTIEMSAVGVKFEDDVLAHIALHKLSPGFKSIRDLLSHTAESSNTSLTLVTVLDHLQQTVLDVQPINSSTALSTERRATYD